MEIVTLKNIGSPRYTAYALDFELEWQGIKIAGQVIDDGNSRDFYWDNYPALPESFRDWFDENEDELFDSIADNQGSSDIELPSCHPYNHVFYELQDELDIMSGVAVCENCGEKVSNA